MGWVSFSTSADFWGAFAKATAGKRWALHASSRGIRQWQELAPPGFVRPTRTKDWEGETRLPPLIVAFGGGTVIDEAKALLYHHLQTLGTEATCSAEIISVPTLAGSGAEVTPFAAVWGPAGKHSLEDPRLQPVKAMLWDGFVNGAPGEDVLAGRLDAFAHTLESCWVKDPVSVDGATIVANVKRLLPLLGGAIDPATSHRETLVASATAGELIARSRTALSHAISYPFTGELGVRHGVAAAFTLPQVARYNAQTNPEQLGPIAQGLGCSPAELCDVLTTMLRPLLVGRAPTPAQVLAIKGPVTASERAFNNVRQISEEEARTIALRAAQSFAHA